MVGGQSTDQSYQKLHESKKQNRKQKAKNNSISYNAYYQNQMMVNEVDPLEEIMEIKEAENENVSISNHTHNFSNNS